jgi:GrpB-like predicted nucleotidyltransferase (UPF0157 family)
MYQEESARLGAALQPHIVALYHVGSTSIPNILAKPIIDILIEVYRIEVVDTLTETMQQQGYRAHGEHGLPGRRFFSKDTAAVRSHHVHIFQSGHPDIARLLGFRDYILANPDAAQRYSLLKQELARRFANDSESYTEAKTDFIRSIERLVQQEA